jgi:prefoldin subunit 5
MANVSQIPNTVKAAIEKAAACSLSEASEDYAQLDALAETLDGQAREVMQSKLDIATLLSKLRQKLPLTPADLKTLEVLIVGDAESFLKYETDLPHWKDEVRRIMTEIGSLSSSNLDVDALLHLRALCQELRRVLPDLVYYLDSRERIAKFRQATEGIIDADGYHVLAEIVTAMATLAKM